PCALRHSPAGPGAPGPRNGGEAALNAGLHRHAVILSACTTFAAVQRHFGASQNTSYLNFLFIDIVD
ncbi:hypothetical protein, partial [Azoarcus sp. TTM-91]|uniref:hypothetical protein n=1 Tax=Azoarcus sp. TTM-91 TaxID=2691581 RepID=UPI001B7CE096